MSIAVYLRRQTQWLEQKKKKQMQVWNNKQRYIEVANIFYDF